jgi:hypothetical protein
LLVKPEATQSLHPIYLNPSLLEAAPPSSSHNAPIKLFSGMAALRTLLDRQLSFERRPGVDGCEPGPFTFLIRSIRKASSRYFEDYKIEGCDVDFQKLETFLSKDSIQYDRKLDKITYRGQEGKSRAIRTSESFGVAIDVLDKQLKNNLEVPLSFIITRLSQEEIASNVKIEGHRRNKRVKLEDLKDSPFSQPSSVNVC